jgi:pimeloyl-ACP methyl ester carboxylesterase
LLFCNFCKKQEKACKAVNSPGWSWAVREANCQYVVIPNARHLAMIDNPEFFNPLLMNFLTKWAPVK